MVCFENVGMRYGLGPEILHDISFELKPGSFHFLSGASGAGKSSLLKLIYLAHHPSRGLVTMFGRDTADCPRKERALLRRRIGVVFQDFRLLEDRTAEENVAFALEVTGAKAETISSRVVRVLTQVGLASKMKALPPELSGGEQQRVAIARALVNDPPILLADEPTGNLDERASRGIFKLLRDINIGGTCVIMATHNLELVRQAPYRTIELRKGGVVFDSAEEDRPAEAAG